MTGWPAGDSTPLALAAGEAAGLLEAMGLVLGIGGLLEGGAAVPPQLLSSRALAAIFRLFRMPTYDSRSFV